MNKTLLVDVGNQRLKWTAITDNQKLSVDELAQHVAKDMQAIDIPLRPDKAYLDRVFSSLIESGASVNRILLSSVAGNAISRLMTSYCVTTWGNVVTMVDARSPYKDLTNSYDNPGQLGSDRWLAAIAGYQLGCIERGEQSVVVVDAGTAVTVDVVRDAQFAGGAILPGFATIVEALGANTGKIEIDFIGIVANPVMGRGRQIDTIATNSNDAVTAGALAAVVGGVERCLAELTSQTNTRPLVLLTGGDAGLLGNMLSQPSERKANLVLVGLGLIAMESSR